MASGILTRQRRIIDTSFGKGKYVFRDEFRRRTTINRAKWPALSDTGGNISLAGGELWFAGGASNWTGTRITGLPLTVVAGLTLDWDFIWTALGGGGTDMGFDASTPVAQALVPGIMQQAGLYVNPSGNILTPNSAATGTRYYFRIVALNPGALWYMATSRDGPWYCWWYQATGFTGVLYEGITNYDGKGRCGAVRLWNGTAPSPVVTQSVAAFTATLGSEEASGALVVGEWYTITATQLDYFYTGSAIGDYFRAAATTALDANNKVQKVTFSTTISGGGDAGRKDGVFGCAPVPVALVGQDGMVAWLDSATSPKYGLFAYYDRLAGTAKLDKDVNGTWTNLISNPAVFSAAAPLVVVAVPGALPNYSVGLYYNDVKQGNTQTIDSTGFGTLFKRFSIQQGTAASLCEVRGAM